MTTLTDGTTTLEPRLWMKYHTTRETRTRTHALMGGGTAVTLAPAGPRVAALALLFSDEAESARCETMLATPGVLTITEPGRDTASMQFIVSGRIERELDEDSSELWIVLADVQEVGAP